ncbi:MAG TPA: dienelactone hydrolase family protein [Ideonella sp.]|nr:dienelactone hydrolase family protein [Ideonella sp.]
MNHITFTSRGKPVAAEMAGPAGTPARGLVVIAYGSDGLTDNLSGPWASMIRGHAEALAAKGFSVLVPDFLAATGTAPGPGVFERIAGCRDAWQAAISDAIDHGVALSKVDPGAVGLLGFSLGGHLALRLRGKAKALVEFFAPVLDGIGGPGPAGHPAQVQIHHGKADALPGTGFANAEAIEQTLRSEGVATELLAYPGAGHGFIGSDLSNQSARDLSKARMLAFFEAHLAVAANPPTPSTSPKESHPMNPTLNGQWAYRSFRHEPIVLKDGQVQGQPDLAIPWSPPGVLVAQTDSAGQVTGSLTFAPGAVLKVTGKIHAAAGKMPASVELIGEGQSSVNRIKGYFVPGSDHVVGTILCTANDLLKQPNGTLGPFVLFPIKA